MSTIIYKQLATARLAINNALKDEAMQTELVRFGFGRQQLEEGIRLYTQALARHEAQKAAYGQKLAASDDFQEIRSQARARYQRHLAYARIALAGDREAHQSLLLAGERKVAFAGWFDQADHFYANALANPDLLEKLADAGLTPEKLEAGQQLLLRTVEAKAWQQEKWGEAIAATRSRDAAVKMLRRWMLVFKQAARMALAESPAELVKLGIRNQMISNV